MKDVQTTGEAPAIKKEHPSLKNMKFLHFILVFLLLWVIFPPAIGIAGPKPELAVQIDADPYESGSTTLYNSHLEVSF
jgi:hypothetical protein